ncbi:MAG: response regulator [Cycloclasticus sp.]
MGGVAHILIVDDEPIGVELMREILSDAEDYEITSAEDGETALKLLEASPSTFDAVLLDQNMPGLSGMQVLEKIKEHPVLSHCPVIFQSGNDDPRDIAAGLRAGAHYYLTKPYDNVVLCSVVKTAVKDYSEYKEVQAELDRRTSLLGLLTSARFEFSTLNEARALAALLSRACPDPVTVATGLTELLLNAIEHGNLQISYAEKTALNETDSWNDEVERRLELPEYRQRKASVEFKLIGSTIELTIQDEGAGFDWLPYLQLSPHRAMDSHGRGIALANTLSFSSLEYRGNGNEVCARVEKDALISEEAPLAVNQA